MAGAVAGIALAAMALMLGVAILLELRRLRADIETSAAPPDWPSVNTFLLQHGCVAAHRDALVFMAGEAGYATSFDPEANTLTLADKGETVRMSMGPAEPD